MIERRVKPQQPTEAACRPQSPLDVVGSERVEDTHVSGLDDQLGVAHGDTEGSSYEEGRLFSLGELGER